MKTFKLNISFQPLHWSWLLCFFLISSWNNSLLANSPVNDECKDAIELILYDGLAGAKYTAGTTIEATKSGLIRDYRFNDDDVWYKFTTDAQGAPNGFSAHIVFDDKIGGGYALYDQCGGGDVDIMGLMSTGSCGDPFSINEALAPINTYYLRVWSAFEGDRFQGNFRIIVYQKESKKRVFNDYCYNATNLSVGNGNCTDPIRWVTEGATDSRFDAQPAPYPNLTGDQLNLDYRGRDVWYKFTMPTSGRIAINGLMGDYSCPYSIVMNFYRGSCTDLKDLGWATYFGGFEHILSGYAGEQIWIRTWIPYNRTNDYNLLICVSTPCGNGNSPDSDRDNVKDCLDKCPDDFFRSVVSQCDCGNAGIRIVKVVNRSACKNNGTSASFDDYYSADVTIEFDRVPKAGSRVNIRGDFQRNITIPSGHNQTTYTLRNQKLKPTGKPIALNAYYAGNSSCDFSTSNAGMSPTPCSDEIASTIISGPTTDCQDLYFKVENVERCFDRGTAYPKDDYYEADLRIHFSNRPTSGILSIEIDNKQTSIPVSSISGNSHLLNNVKISAAGYPVRVSMSFSANASCVATQQLEPLKVRDNRICHQCNIMNVSVMDLVCTDRGVDLSLLVSGNLTGTTYNLSNGMTTATGNYGQISTFSLQAGESIEIVNKEDTNCRYRFQLDEHLCASGSRYTNFERNQLIQELPIYSYAEGGAEMATLIENELPISQHEGSRFNFKPIYTTNKALTVFPNPTTNTLNMELETQFQAVSPIQVRVYNALGKIIIEEKRQANSAVISLNVNAIPTGVYLIELTNNMETRTTQFVKE